MEKWLTVDEASELTGYSPRWIRELARNSEKNKIIVKRWGWSFMIDKESLLKYKEEKEEKKSR